jgi:hypothetical protein
MADEYVSGAQFGEFVKRMEDRFDHAEQLAKEREDKMSVRFDAVDKRLNDLWKMMAVMLGGILAGAIAAVVKAFL